MTVSQLMSLVLKRNIPAGAGCEAIDIAPDGRYVYAAVF
jgi:hypothetical protein